MTANQPGIPILKTDLFRFPQPITRPSGKRSRSQTGLNRPVFLPLIPLIPNYKPNTHKSGKTFPKTPHSGRLENTGPKQNTPILSPYCHSGQYLVHGQFAGPKKRSHRRRSPGDNVQTTYGFQTKIEKYRYIFIIGMSHQTILPAYIQ
jgi:hypothetical protein